MAGAPDKTLQKIIVFSVCVAALIAGPAHAKTIDHIEFQFRPTAYAQIVESGEGYKVISVASNAPFRVLIKNVIGEVRVDMHTGEDGIDTNIGKLAQIPGPISSCRVLASFMENEIYRSDRKTAARPGALHQQAVQLTIRFDPNADPELRVMPISELEKNAIEADVLCQD